MKRAAAFIIFSMFICLAPAAQSTDVTYTEGEATERTTADKVRAVQIGDSLRVGDSVRTGRDGLVEMNQEGITLKVGPGTVFTLMELERGGEKTGVVAVTLGSLKMLYKKLTGKEPFVQTASCAVAVRGTELTIYSGADGSSLISVTSGTVSVEAQGETVDLDSGKGIEVKPGEPPGEKFNVQREQIDYRKWNDEKVAAMLADPLSALAGIREQMISSARNVDEYFAYFKEYSLQLDRERQKAADIQARNGVEESNRYVREVVFPLQLKTSNFFLNLRYFALAALSLKRYVAGRMYLPMKARYITAAADPVYATFLEEYMQLAELFERSIAPQLVAADI